MHFYFCNNLEESVKTLNCIIFSLDQTDQHSSLMGMVTNIKYTRSLGETGDLPIACKVKDTSYASKKVWRIDRRNYCTTHWLLTFICWCTCLSWIRMRDRDEIFTMNPAILVFYAKDLVFFIMTSQEVDDFLRFIVSHVFQWTAFVALLELSSIRAVVPV